MFRIWVICLLASGAGSACAEAVLEKIPDGRRESPLPFPGYLETQMQPDGKLLFTIATVGGGEHVCRLHGAAEPTELGAFLFVENSTQCVFKISASEGSLFTEDVERSCEKQSCGSRNMFGTQAWTLQPKLPVTDEIRPSW